MTGSQIHSSPDNHLIPSQPASLRAAEQYGDFDVQCLDFAICDCSGNACGVKIKVHSASYPEVPASN